jgi:hypothetical protein
MLSVLGRGNKKTATASGKKESGTILVCAAR